MNKNSVAPDQNTQQPTNTENCDAISQNNSRRKVLKSGAVLAASGIAGFPLISKSQSDVIKIGHLTPRTGF